MSGNNGESKPKRRKPISRDTVIFGNNVRRLMIVRGVTYAEIVRITGIPKATVWRYLNGVSEIPLDAAFKIARLFNYEAHVLINKEGVKE